MNLLHTRLRGASPYLLAALFGITFLGYLGSQPLLLEDGQLLAPADDRYVVLPANKSAQQTLTARHDNISALFIRTPDSSNTLSVTIAGDNVRRVAHPAASTLAPNDGPLVPPGAWKAYTFNRIADSKDKTFTVTIEAQSHSLRLPMEVDETKQPDQTLYVAGQEKAGNIALVTAYHPSVATKLRYYLIEKGLLTYLLLSIAVGLSVGIAYQIFYRARLGQSLITSTPASLFLLLAIVYSLPLYTEPNAWGGHDWSEGATHYSAARHALQAGQFPMWNPYICGGAPLWGNPQTYWFSPVLLFTLPFGEAVGSKLAITAYLFIGMCGMHTLARRLGMASAPALAPAILYMGSGFLASHILMGQMLWLTIAWIPWSLVYFLKSMANRWYLVPAVLFYLLIFFEGRSHLVAYLTLIIILTTIGLTIPVQRKNRQRAFVNLLLFGSLALTLGAVRLLPVLYFMNDLEGSLESTSGTPLSKIIHVLTTPTASELYSQPWMQAAWHEYNGYIGIGGLALAALGIAFAFFRRNAQLIVLFTVGIIFLSITTAPAGQSLLDFLPVTKELRNQTRAIIIVVMVLALFSGWALHNMQRMFASKVIASGATLLIGIMLFVDVHLAAAPSWDQAFTQKPLAYNPPQNMFFQESERHDIAYHIVAAGFGARNYCPPFLRQWNQGAQVFGAQDEGYAGEVYTANNSQVELTAATPNRFSVDIHSVSQEGDTLYINQRYTSGWFTADNRQVFEDMGRIALHIGPADKDSTVHVSFLQPGLLLGLGITLATAAGLAFAYGRHHMQRIDKNVRHATMETNLKHPPYATRNANETSSAGRNRPSRPRR